MSRRRVAKRGGDWVIFTDGIISHRFTTLDEALDAAAAQALADAMPSGGWARLRWMRQMTADIEYLRRWKATP